METTLEKKTFLKLIRTVFAGTLLFFASTVISYAQPLAASAGSNVTICQGSSTVIGGSPTASYGSSPYTYSWSPTTGLSSSTVANPTATPTATTTYTVTVTDAVATSSTSTVVVTVNPNPTVIVNSPTICSGQTVNLTASGATTYSWNPLGATGSTVTVSPSSTTTYTVTGTNSSGCTATAISTVTVNPTPGAPTASSNSPVCVGSTLSLSASAAGGATYSWSGPAGFTSSLQNPMITNVTAANAGIYYVTKTISGCTSPAGSTSVTVNANPTVNAGADLTVCFGNAVAFSASASGAITYSWNFGDGGSSTVLNPTYTYPTAGVYTATLAATSSAGCTSSDNLLVTVSDPVLSLSSTNVLCFGDCNGTASASVSGGAGGYSFIWSPGSSTSSSISGLCGGTYTVSVTDVAGCSSNTSIVISEPPPLSVSISSTSVSCFAACDGTASATVAGGVAPYTYSWAPGGIATQVVSGLCAGSYTVNVSDVNSCNVSNTITLTDPASLSVTTSPNDTICLTFSSTIYATPAGGVFPYSYVWNDGVTNFSTSDSTTVSPLSNSSYTVTVTDANGCTSNGVAIVVVYANNNIDGHVSYSGGSLSSGINKAYLFNYVSGFSTFDTVQSTTVDASGNYLFASVNAGDYLVKVFPDTLVYPTLVPTYYGNEYLWDSATVVFHGCFGLTTADIIMVEGITGVGPGMISGHISEGAGFMRTPGDPVPGIDIKLGRNPGGALITNTQTDSNGDYFFNNIPVNTPGEYYTIYVDIPGLERDSTYNVVITASDPVFPDLNYIADSSSVYPDQTGVGITALTPQENKLNVFPNPTTGEINIQFTTKNTVEILSIADLTGRVIYFSKINMLQGESLKLNLQNLGISSGTYVMNLKNSGMKYKIILIEN